MDVYLNQDELIDQAQYSLKIYKLFSALFPSFVEWVEKYSKVITEGKPYLYWVDVGNNKYTASVYCFRDNNEMARFIEDKNILKQLHIKIIYR